MALVYPSLYEGFGLATPGSDGRGHTGRRDAVLVGPRGRGRRRALFRGTVARRTGPGDGASRHGANRSGAGLRDRGLQRAADFRWEKTARAAFEVYRSAVLEPAERSLRARRMLRVAILHWSELSLSELSVAHDRPDDVSDELSIAGCAQRLARVECRSEREDAPRAETLQARQGSRDILTSRGRRPPSARGKHRTPTGGRSLRRARITSHLPTLRGLDPDIIGVTWMPAPIQVGSGQIGRGPNPAATALRVKRLRILNNPPHECRR